MNAFKSMPIAATAVDLETEQKTPFLFTEECGLALFFNRQNGQKFCLERENLDDLTRSLRGGWRPDKSL